MSGGLALLVGLGIAPAAAVEAPRLRVAVLEALVPPGTPPNRGMDWTDAVRGAIQRQLGDSHLVLTRQNIEALLPPGADLADCEGDCETETGRNVGADLVVRIRVKAAEVEVTLLNTRDGRVVGDARFGIDPSNSAPIDAALVRATEIACAQVARPAPPPIGERALEVRRGGQYGFVRVESPHGATISVDGHDRGTTPVLLRTGAPIRFEARATGYRTGRFRVEAPARGGVVTVDLAASEGDLRLADLPSGATVTLDGGEPSPARAFRLSAGRHRLVIHHRCFAPDPIDVEIAAGETTRPDLTPALRCPYVLLLATTPDATASWPGGEAVPLPAVILGEPGALIAVAVHARARPVEERLVEVPAAGRREERFDTRIPEVPFEVSVVDEYGEICDAEIRVDGDAVGRGRWRGAVGAGRHNVESDCRNGTLKVVDVGPETAPVRLVTGQLRTEFGVRSAPGRTSQFVLGLHMRQVGGLGMRFGLGAGLGVTRLPDDPQLLATVDLSLGVPLVRWLELTSRVAWGDSSACPEAEDPKCDVNHTALAGGVRLLFDGWLFADAEYGVTFEDARRTSLRTRHGPAITVGIAVPHGARRNK